MNDTKKTEHPQEQKRNFKQHIDLPGDMQISEKQCQDAGYFKAKYPKGANEKGVTGGSDGQRSDL